MKTGNTVIYCEGCTLFSMTQVYQWELGEGWAIEKKVDEEGKVSLKGALEDSSVLEMAINNLVCQWVGHKEGVGGSNGEELLKSWGNVYLYVIVGELENRMQMQTTSHQCVYLETGKLKITEMENSTFMVA